MENLSFCETLLLSAEIEYGLFEYSHKKLNASACSSCWESKYSAKNTA